MASGSGGSGGEEFVTKSDGQKLYVLGDRKAFLSVQKWHGRIQIHIRNHMVPGDLDERNGVVVSEYIPTKKGVALNYGEFKRLCSMQGLVDRLVGELSAEGSSQRPTGHVRPKKVMKRSPVPTDSRKDDTIILGDDDDDDHPLLLRPFKKLRK